ncbi:MAG: type IV pilus biogenesis protein PilP [Acidithiobacillus sp.]
MCNNRKLRDTSSVLRTAILATALIGVAAPIPSCAGIAPVGMLLSQPAGPARAAKSAGQRVAPKALALAPGPERIGTSAGQITGTVSAGHLAQAESRIAMLKMQLEIAKLNAGIAKANAQAKHPGGKTSQPMSPYGGMLPAGGMPSFSSVPSSKSSASVPAPALLAATPAPRVLSLSGAGGHYQATLALPNGEVMTVVDGSRLGHGWRVRKVSAAGVTATHAGQVIPLGFSGSSGGAPSQGGHSDAPGANPVPGANPNTGFTPPNLSSGGPMPGVGPMPPFTPPTFTPPKG